jgi:hypothetical protein
MDVQTLWERLTLPDGQLAVFKADIAEGKVPELPFYIVGQTKAKEVIKGKLENIDSARMLTNLVIAEYGNGKTNLLKYLELYFRTYKDLGVSVEYSRADVDRTDLVLFLLKILQDKYLDAITEAVKQIRQTPDAIPGLVNNYESNFREIKPYSEALFSPGNSDADIVDIIYLGTGRLNNKRYFDKRQLEQLRDFNRREIFVLFLNLLSHQSQYIIFAVDEIEKIREKSKIRFSHFLTSYRELVDLFNQIKGHYLLVSFTDSVGAQEISTTNDALYTRIKNDIISIEALRKKDDVIELITYLNELFQTNKQIEDIYTSFSKKNSPNTRLAIQEISRLLYEQESVITLKELIEKGDLTGLYKETEEKLEADEAFKNMHRKFFDPFEYYIESLGMNSEYLNKQDRLFRDVLNEKLHYFVFNEYLEDFENEKIKIERFLQEYPEYKVVIYTPVKLELSHSKLELPIDKVDIVDIEPRELFILLSMYRENYDHQPEISDIITKYTNSKL